MDSLRHQYQIEEQEGQRQENTEIDNLWVCTCNIHQKPIEFPAPSVRILLQSSPTSQQSDPVFIKFHQHVKKTFENYSLRISIYIMQDRHDKETNISNRKLQLKMATKRQEQIKMIREKWSSVIQSELSRFPNNGSDWLTCSSKYDMVTVLMAGKGDWSEEDIVVERIRREDWWIEERWRMKKRRDERKFGRSSLFIWKWSRWRGNLVRSYVWSSNFKF